MPRRLRDEHTAAGGKAKGPDSPRRDLSLDQALIADGSADRRTLHIGRNPVTSKFLLRFSCGVIGFPSIAFQSRVRALPCRAIALACPVHALSFSANPLPPVPDLPRAATMLRFTQVVNPKSY